MKYAARNAMALCLALMLLFLSIPALAGYATLEFGSRGSAVLKLQKALLALGFDPSGTDGKFGRGTENAVKLYQASRGLEADGKAGNLTLTALYAENAPATSPTGEPSTGAPAPVVSVPVATNPSTLKYGDRGTRVEEMQAMLQKLGYYTGALDASFGAGTQQAVIAFQKASGLKADGLAGTKTLAALSAAYNSMGAANTAAPAPAPAPNAPAPSTSLGSRTLRKGVQGADVGELQRRLAELGYYTGSIDNSFGSGTLKAVKAFQQKNGLSADGVAGSQTFAKLLSGAAIGANGAATPTPAPIAPAPAPEQSAAYTNLSSGSSGDAVTRLQSRLAELGYAAAVTGKYDAATQQAVIEFQRRNALTADGVAGAKTQTALYSASAKDASTKLPELTELEEGAGITSGPSASEVALLHWYNEVKPSIKSGQKVTIFDPDTSLSWKLRLYSLGHHADSEPLTLRDTQIMFKAFGYTNTWTPKPVYVQLPSGRWTLASMHNVPHLSGSIKDNGFDGHLCVHFLRDMSECEQNDPNYGVQHQNAIRKRWKQMTGQDVAYQ